MRCEECGFAYAGVPAAAVPRRVADAGPRFAAAVATIPDPRRRPAPDVWSPLEYTCHVRDVLRVQHERLEAALRWDNPPVKPMGREERAESYHAEDPATAVQELTGAAVTLARAFAALTPTQWQRTTLYNWPTTEARSMLWLARHTIHEIDHHLLDATR